MKKLSKLVNEVGNIINISDALQIAEAKENKDFFFKNIIFFTNDKDEKKNKTLKNLVDAVKGKDVEIISFIAEDVTYKADDKKIHIEDKDTKYTIDKQSNIDTIVIARLGVQDSEEAMECLKELQDWGLFVLNPIQAAKKASNKYTSAVLGERYGIPQPKFCLVSASDVSEGQHSLNKKLKAIYPDIKDDMSDKQLDEMKYVIKILDGHGGTGVFMSNHKSLLAILQAMFAIDPERQLLVQHKEEGDGGDIRVHVLTMRTGQKILASMKRKKLGKDFRSNISLGATAEKVSLTKEQEELALKVAKISGMPWCAVDIMPLVKGSNPEIGDNVILEWNASPGTDGISEVIGENFMSILLDAINDINELVLAPKAVGYIENITFTLDDDTEVTIEAKLDTGNGAKASTIGCEELMVEGNSVKAKIKGKEVTFEKAGESYAKVGQVQETRTTVIIPTIKIGSRRLKDVEFALVDDRDKSTDVLLNRDILAKMAYMVNPSRKHVIEDPLAVDADNRRKK